VVTKRELQRLKPELERILGSGNVLWDEKKLKEYSRDMADFRGDPVAVVRPGSTEELSRLVRLANRERIPIVPWGAGSSLTGAAISHAGVVVEMSRFDRIIEVDTVNWFVHVQAGVILDRLNRELEKSGFFFPPDPASSFICTVGGVLSEGAGGLRCVRYGTVKDWVLALKVVLPNGDVAIFGEPLPKNRAGYDLVHLFVGSEGTLGIIVEAWLKIQPIPYRRITRMMTHFHSWKPAVQAITRLRSERVQAALLEFMDGNTVKAVNRDFGTSFPVHPATLLIDLEEELVQKSLAIIRSCGAAEVVVAKNEEEAEAMYQARAWSYIAVRSEATGSRAEDVCVPITKLADYLTFVEKVSKRRRLKIVVHGHAGDGNVHPLILFDKNDRESVKRADAAFEDICEYAIRVGGTITGEHGIGSQKVRLLRKQLIAHGGAQPLKIMKAIKRMLDKRGIMNPGKYVEAA
jgi:glycolate oxidase